MRPPLPLLALVTLAACKRAPERTPEPTRDPVPVSAPASASVSPSAAAPAPASASPSAPAALDEAERERAARYLTALGRGRRATRGKDFDAAIKAFDEALAIRPNDGVALAERGYAKLQAKDLDGARKDLEEAHHRAGSAETIAQVWHNLGLLEQEAGNMVVATDYLERARALRAKARAGKGAGGACAAQVHRSSTPGVVVASWVEVWKAVLKDFEKRFSQPFAHTLGASPSEDVALAALAGNGNEGAGMWAVRMDTDYGGAIHHVVARRADKKLVLFTGLGESLGGRCGGGVSSVKVESEGAPHAVLESHTAQYGLMCELPNGEPQVCSGAPGETPVQSFCGTGTYSVEAYYFDLDKARQILRITQDGPDDAFDEARLVTLVAQRDGVQIVGPGCNTKELFAK